MPSNVEIKARIPNLEVFKQKAAELSKSEGTVIPQEDVFFNVPAGRLKLRKLQDDDSQLIFYERADDSGPKTSNYSIARTREPSGLEQVLGQALGVKGWVKKVRTLYMVGQTRVHVDQVEGLGSFMELEVVMQEGQSTEEGMKIAEDLMRALEVSRDHLLSGAYLDLILQDKSVNGTKV